MEQSGRTDYLIFLAADYPLGVHLLLSHVLVVVQLAGCAIAGVGLSLVQRFTWFGYRRCAIVRASIGQG